jgi:hypothetical protein
MPPVSEVRAALLLLNMRQVAQLAKLTDTPERTSHKIRLAQTSNPGIETLRKFMPRIREVLTAEQLERMPGASPPATQPEAAAAPVGG